MVRLRCLKVRLVHLRVGFAFASSGSTSFVFSRPRQHWSQPHCYERNVGAVVFFFKVFVFGYVWGRCSFRFGYWSHACHICACLLGVVMLFAFRIYVVSTCLLHGNRG